MLQDEIPVGTRGADTSRARLEFLMFGFVVDPERAKRYLSDLLRRPAGILNAPGVDHRPGDFKQTLCSVVEGLTFKKGHKQVGLSLSAGLDSRALLGALLEIYQPRDIQALTYGARSHPDRVGAERLQRKIGFAHTVVDFSDYTWQAHELEERVGRQYNISGRLDSIGSVQTYAVRSQLLGDLPILQGFLGDALAMPQHRSSTFSFQNVASSEVFRRDVEEFLLNNDVMRHGSRMTDEIAGTLANVRSKVTSHLQECAPWLDRFTGLSSYDLLHFGFRQGLRIRPDTEFMPSILLPFEHHEWVAYWLGQPLVRRSNKSHYRQCLLESFPRLFQDLQETGRFKSLASHIRLLGRKALSRIGIPVPPNKGDPRRSEQLRHLMLSLARSFDARGVVAYEVQSDLERWLRRGDAPAAQRVKWAVSLELHIRAGNV
jgi:hypothetical protein